MWKTIVLSKLIYHCAICGKLAAECSAKVTSAYHKCFRIIRGFQSGKLSANTRTDTGVRAGAGMPPLADLIAVRRIGVLRRVLASGAHWLTGVMVHAKGIRRSWGRQMFQSIDWLQSYEPGCSVTHEQFF